MYKITATYFPSLRLISLSVNVTKQPERINLHKNVCAEGDLSSECIKGSIRLATHHLHHNHIWRKSLHHSG